MKRQKFSSYSEMPDGLRNFLFTKDFADAESVLQKRFDLTDAERVLIGDQVMDTVFGDQELGDMVKRLKAALVPAKLDEAKWRQLLTDVIQKEFWPIRDLFGDELTRVLDENQVSTAGWPDAKVYLKPMTYSAAAGEIATRGGFSLLGPQSRERLRDLIMSKAKGVRIDAQVKEVLVRPADFGGLGLDAATAEKTIKAINEMLASVKVMSEDEYADWLADEARKKTEAENRAKEGEIKTEEDREIAEIKAKMPAKPATVLDDVVEKSYAALTWKPADEYLVNRLRHIISSRLRDVRSALEVEQLLQRDTKVGGVGLEPDKARSLAKEIEVAYAASHDQVLSEEKLKIDQQLVEQKAKIEQRKLREAEEHAKWYQEKILARKQEEDQKKRMAEQMRQSFMGGAAGQAPPAEKILPVDMKEDQKEKQRFGDMVPAVAAGAAPIAVPLSKPAAESRPPAAPAAPAADKVPQPAPFAAPVAAVQAARPEVKVSKETIVKQPLAAGLKPRVDDVKYGPRLVSLVDELKTISLSEFRRMAKDPQQAAQKIFQKLETLGGESFEKRTQGIKAFQSSPLQQSYLSLVGESFKQGKSVQDIAEAKRAAGEDAPAPAEIAAVISLNSKLHY